MAKVYLDSMGNPIVEKPKVYLDSNGNVIADTQVAPAAPRLATLESRARAVAPPTASPALNFFMANRREVRRSPESDEPISVQVTEAMFPRASKAYYKDPSDFGRRAAGATLDVASAPGRVLSAVFAPTDTTKTFAQQVANTGSPDNVSDTRRVAHEIVTDPANAFLAGEVSLGKRGVDALAKVLPKVAPEAAAKIANMLSREGKVMGTLRSVGRGARDVGLPLGAVTGASDYADNASISDALLNAALVGGAGSMIAPAMDATRVVGSKVMQSAPVRAIKEKVGETRNPFYVSPGSAVEEASASGLPLDYTGLRTAATLSDAAKGFMESDALKFLQSPAFTTAKKLLREQVKPAPAAKKGMELEDFISTLDAPGMFDKLTKYRDIVGGVGGFGKRNLAKIEETNAKTWNPLFREYQNQEDIFRQAYNDALRGTDYWETPELRELYEYLGSSVPRDRAERLSGLKVGDVAAHTRDIGDEAIRSRSFGGDPKMLARALRDQLRIYATPQDATLNSIVTEQGLSPSLEHVLPIDLAHRAKSQQFQRAFSSGVPDDMTSARQFAANIVGKAHNRALDDLIKMFADKEAQVLPSPMLRPNREELEFARNLLEGSDPVTEAMRDFAFNKTEGPVYDLQRKYLSGGELPPADEVSKSILQDQANANLLESRRAELNARSADLEFENRLRNDADEAQANYNEIREATNRRRRPGLPRMPDKPREAFEREVRDRLSTDDINRYTQDVMGPANERVKQIMEETINDWRDNVVAPWLAKWTPYREAKQGVSKALSRTRQMDAAMQPWYKAEAALQRAANTGGNRYSFRPLDLVLPTVGAGVGAGVDRMQGDDGVIDGAAIGAALGMTPFAAARLLRTPAGPKLLRDVGRASFETARGAARNAGADLSSTALYDILSSIPVDWADRLRSRKFNDGRDSSTNDRVAEKKGATK